VRNAQGKALAKRFNTPMSALSSLYTVFPNAPEEGVKNDIFHQDLVGVVSRIFLPMLLNSTLFRNSNILIKGLVGLFSQKASDYINEDSVLGIWDKVRTLFEKRKKKQADYGIPPESEAS
jgi:hypothetical protein